MNLTGPDNTSDVFLLSEIRRGNAGAFNTLYERYWMKAYSNAYKRLKDEELSKDVVQEIFINIWQNREREIDHFPAYLYTAVRNQVFKAIEKQKGRSYFLDMLDIIPSISSHADAEIRRKEFFAAYEALLKTLPPRRRAIFRLRFQENLTTRAIADQLGISRKSVQNQIGKGVDQLRVSLTRLLLIVFVFLFL